MSETFNHKCIKCEKEYTDTDPDPYYCEQCNKERLAIAKRVNRQVAQVQSKRPHKSALQEYNESTDKVRGFLRVRL